MKQTVSATLHCKTHLVGDHDHGHALSRQCLHHIQHLVDHLRVQGRSGLVKEHDLRPHGQASRYGHPLLLATRELIRIGVGLLGNVHLLEQFVGIRLGLFPLGFRTCMGARVMFWSAVIWG